MGVGEDPHPSTMNLSLYFCLDISVNIFHLCHTWLIFKFGTEFFYCKIVAKGIKAAVNIRYTECHLQKYADVFSHCAVRNDLSSSQKLQEDANMSKTEANDKHHQIADDYAYNNSLGFFRLY